MVAAAYLRSVVAYTKKKAALNKMQDDSDLSSLRHYSSNLLSVMTASSIMQLASLRFVLSVQSSRS